MKSFSTLLVVLLFSFATNAQNVNDYFESIRNNKAALTMFFSAMPKGGDLHHHYSGSIYTETYIDFVVDNNYCINLNSLEVRASEDGKDGFVRFQSMTPATLSSAKQRLIQKWSVKDYNGISYPSDKQFFETFPNFNVAASKTFEEGLMELKLRAKKENVSYIETMFTTIVAPFDASGFDKQRQQLNELSASKDKQNIAPVLLSLTNTFNSDAGLNTSINAFNEELAQRHQRLQLDDSQFTIRYQNYVVRIMDNPVDFFKNLWVCFESAKRSKLIVGVNIVAPENDEVSMKYYWLHMQMFRFLGEHYPDVKFAMHAGELALGMVKPEDLTWHINAAVFEAKAHRIGHGVDLPYEEDAPALLDYMSRKKVAVEINLTSNEFILKVKEDRHPIMLYKKYGVPIVISTDDAGVLRSNLIEQYVLLANRYPAISYAEIREMVFNSIDYSFIEDESQKKSMIADLRQRFRKFESSHQVNSGK